MYAIVELGPTQYKVAEGDTVVTHRLEGEIGGTVTLEKILLTENADAIQIGRPYLNNVKVTAQVMAHPLGEKLIAFKFRNRKNFKTTKGHRQKLTSLKISKISIG